MKIVKVKVIEDIQTTTLSQVEREVLIDKTIIFENHSDIMKYCSLYKCRLEFKVPTIIDFPVIRKSGKIISRKIDRLQPHAKVLYCKFDECCLHVADYRNAFVDGKLQFGEGVK